MAEDGARSGLAWLRWGVGRDGKIDRLREVRLILIASRMPLERERVARRQPQAMGLAIRILIPAFGLLDADDRHGVAAGLRGIASGILELLQIAMRIGV